MNTTAVQWRTHNQHHAHAPAAYLQQRNSSGTISCSALTGKVRIRHSGIIASNAGNNLFNLHSFAQLCAHFGLIVCFVGEGGVCVLRFQARGSGGWGEGEG